jgi:acetyltransferase-like isoleucine patch superfamily enzyme
MYELKGKNHNIWGNPEIGDGTVICDSVEIGKEVKIGKDCKIEAKVFIPPGVTIGDNVFIAPCVCFTNDKYPKAHGDWELVKTIVENDVSIGANSTIVCGVTIHKGALIGAGSVVTKDVPEYTTVKGNPAR